MKKVEIFCHNTGTKHSYPMGTSLMEISKDLNIQLKHPVCGAIVTTRHGNFHFVWSSPNR